MSRVIGWIVALGLILTVSAGATAKTERELGYRYPVVWKTAIRFVRVDLGSPLLEKDKDAGYLLFEYKDGGRTNSGSIELFEILKNGRQMVKVRLKIPSQPSYVEGVLVDKFVRKLKEEFGREPFIELPKEPPAPQETAKERAKEKQPSEEDGSEQSED